MTTTTTIARPLEGLAPLTAEGTSPTARLVALATGVGPVLLIGSSLAWLAGDDLAELRGILSLWALPAMALAIAALAGRLERVSPLGRAVVTGLVAVGAVAGGAFAQEVSMAHVFGTERLIDQDTPAAVFGLRLPGPMFPASIIVLGLLSARYRTLPRAQALLLAAAGVLFPLSRIPQKPALAVVADACMLAALAPVAVAEVRRTFRGRRAGRAA